MGSTAALRFGHHLHDLSEHCVRAHALGAHDERAGPVDRAADELLARSLGHRNGLARDHRFIDGACALQHPSVHRYRFAGAYPQPVSGLHGIQGNLLVGPSVVDAAGEFGRKIKQGPNGAAGSLPRAQLEHLPQEHEHRDDRGGFEVHGNETVLAS